MNLIFDFDGTLCDSIKIALETVNQILGDRGYKKTNDLEIKNIGLKGLVESRKINETETDSIITEYRRIVESKYSHAKLFAGLGTVLQKLSSKNKLGILTTNKTEIVKGVLGPEYINIFSFINSEKGVFDKHIGLISILNKYNFDSNETYYIGDETRDVEAAKKAGIKSVSVTWGAENKSLLEKSRPDIIVTKPIELLKI